MYEKTLLDNRLTVATHQMPKRVSVALGIWLKVGARYEAEEINGISHFLEHLLFKGTYQRTCKQIKETVEGVGGSLNGFTGQEVTCYFARVPDKHLGVTLDVLRDMVLNSCLAPEDIEMERKVILEEISMYKDLPAHFVVDLLGRLLWPDQPLGRNIAGENEIIRRVTREQLIDFKQSFYHLNNMVVVACGNLKHRHLLEACRRLFPSGKKGALKGRFSRAVQRQTIPQMDLHVKQTEQTHLAMGLHGLPCNHAQRFSLALLHIILGANMSSRLFHEVREVRGLAYGISSSLKYFQDTGVFTIHAGIDNQRVLEAVDVILEQLRQIRKHKVDKKELQRAREYYIGQLNLSMEDTCEQMLWMGEHLLSLNRFLHPRQAIREVKAVTPESLQETAKKILRSSSLNLALIGPIKEKDKKQIKERLTIN